MVNKLYQIKPLWISKYKRFRRLPKLKNKTVKGDQDNKKQRKIKAVSVICDLLQCVNTVNSVVVISN